MRPKIGIVGGSGFIGSSLAKHIVMSFNVRLLDVKRPRQEFGDGKAGCRIVEILRWKRRRS